MVYVKRCFCVSVCGDGWAFMHSCGHDLSECSLINKHCGGVSAERSRRANLQRVASYFLQARSIYNAVLGTEDAQRMGRQGWGRLFLIKIKRFILCYGLFLHTHTHTHTEEISHCVLHIHV